jgi:hypothetical protein
MFRGLEEAGLLPVLDIEQRLLVRAKAGCVDVLGDQKDQNRREQKSADRWNRDRSTSLRNWQRPGDIGMVNAVLFACATRYAGVVAIPERLTGRLHYSCLRRSLGTIGLGYPLPATPIACTYASGVHQPFWMSHLLQKTH